MATRPTGAARKRRAIDHIRKLPAYLDRHARAAAKRTMPIPSSHEKLLEPIKHQRPPRICPFLANATRRGRRGYGISQLALHFKTGELFCDQFVVKVLAVPCHGTPFDWVTSVELSSKNALKPSNGGKALPDQLRKRSVIAERLARMRITRGKYPRPVPKRKRRGITIFASSLFTEKPAKTSVLADFFAPPCSTPD